jgi:hypothetical protein
VESQVIAGLQQYDYVASSTERKYSDGLGINAKTSNEEFFIECSSSINNENISHTLDDSIEIIVKCFKLYNQGKQERIN